jgi:hypothetical protein
MFSVESHAFHGVSITGGTDQNQLKLCVCRPERQACHTRTLASVSVSANWALDRRHVLASGPITPRLH